MSIDERLERIERLLIAGNRNVMTTREAAEFIGVSECRMRQMASKREVPHAKSRGKLVFSRTELEDWLLKDRVPTLAEDLSAYETRRYLRAYEK